MVKANIWVGLNHSNGSFSDETCLIDYDITDFSKYGYDIQNMNEDDVWNMFADMAWPEQDIEEMFENHPNYNKKYGISLSINKIVKEAAE